MILAFIKAFFTLTNLKSLLIKTLDFLKIALHFIWENKTIVTIAILTFVLFLQFGKIKDLNVEKGKLQTELSDTKQELAQVKTDIESIQKINKRLNSIKDSNCKKQNIIRSQTKKLSSLPKTEAEKELFVNVSNRIRCFELATGAEKNPFERNKVCPDYLQ